MIDIEVVYCPPGATCDRVRLRLPAGTTVAHAIESSGLAQRHALTASAMDVGVWGRRCAPTQLLRDRDRVELYRPLRCDPKQARRERYRARVRGADGGSGGA